MAISRTTKNIRQLFRNIGVKPTLNGYFYWPYAVELAIKRGDSNWKICKDIYLEVADKFGTTASRVERSMRTITNGYQVKIKKYFDVKFEKITNKEFLALLVEYVKGRRK